MPTPRSHVQAGLVKYSDGSEHIVVAGGYDGSFYSDVTEIFHLQTQTWSTGDNLPVEIRDGASVPFEDSFLIVGGYSSNGGGYLDTIHYFNPLLQKWETRDETMKDGRYLLAAFMVPNSYSNCL